MTKITTEDIMFLDKANEFIKNIQDSFTVLNNEKLQEKMRTVISEVSDYIINKLKEK